MNCSICGEDAEFIRYHLKKNGKLLWLGKYVCKCGASVGTHIGTENPLGTFADKYLRMKRIEVHFCFDKLWKSGGMTRRQAYSKLANYLKIGIKDCHIGMFDSEKCNMAMVAIEEIKKEKENADE